MPLVLALPAVASTARSTRSSHGADRDAAREGLRSLLTGEDEWDAARLEELPLAAEHGDKNAEVWTHIVCGDGGDEMLGRWAWAPP